MLKIFHTISVSKFSFKEPRLVYGDRIDIILDKAGEALSKLFDAAAKLLDVSTSVVQKGVKLIDLGFAYGEIAVDRVREWNLPKPPKLDHDCFTDMSRFIADTAELQDASSYGASNVSEMRNIEDYLIKITQTKLAIAHHNALNRDLLSESGFISTYLKNPSAYMSIAEDQDSMIKGLADDIESGIYQSGGSLESSTRVAIDGIKKSRAAVPGAEEGGLKRYLPVFVRRGIAAPKFGGGLLLPGSFENGFVLNRDKRVTISNVEKYGEALRDLVSAYKVKLDDKDNGLLVLQNSLEKHFEFRLSMLLKKNTPLDSDSGDVKNEKIKYREAIFTYFSGRSAELDAKLTNARRNIQIQEDPGCKPVVAGLGTFIDTSYAQEEFMKLSKAEREKILSKGSKDTKKKNPLGGVGPSGSSSAVTSPPPSESGSTEPIKRPNPLDRIGTSP